MSHGDKVTKIPEGFELIAESDNCPIATIQNTKLNIYGVQFHPEVVHTPEGKKILMNFALNICKCIDDWEMSKFIESSINHIKVKCK